MIIEAKHNEPDAEALAVTELDYPNKTDAKKYRLAQAEMLLRKCGYERCAYGDYRRVEMNVADGIRLLKK
jgi:hypothetical protein